MMPPAKLPSPAGPVDVLEGALDYAEGLMIALTMSLDA